MGGALELGFPCLIVRSQSVPLILPCGWRAGRIHSCLGMTDRGGQQSPTRTWWYNKANLRSMLHQYFIVWNSQAHSDNT